MANTSATGGYLLPSTPTPAYGLSLDGVFQRVVAALSGLNPANVRPAVQPNDPVTGQVLARIPNADTNWCAVRVEDVPGLEMPSQTHISDGDGSTVLQRIDVLDVTVFCYGPDSDGIARQIRDLLYVSQNREALRAQGLEFNGYLSLINVPDMPSVGTRRRSDLKLRFFQTVERTLPILNLLEAQGTVRTDGGSVSASGEYDAPFDTKD